MGRQEKKSDALHTTTAFKDFIPDASLDYVVNLFRLHKGPLQLELTLDAAVGPENRVTYQAMFDTERGIFRTADRDFYTRNVVIWQREDRCGINRDVKVVGISTDMRIVLLGERHIRLCKTAELIDSSWLEDFPIDPMHLFFE